MINTNRERGEMMEQFAEMEHTRWANWQSYLHSKCTKNADGSLTIPVESVIHWERQISTPYSQLTEREKESDRNEVRPYLEVFAQALKDARESALKEVNETIMEARMYNNWKHTRGSHSDDSQDREQCDCMEKEIAAKNDAYDAMLKRVDLLSSSPDNQPK